MGQGDKKTKPSKINLGTHGKTLPRKIKVAEIITSHVAILEVTNFDSTKKN